MRHQTSRPPPTVPDSVIIERRDTQWLVAVTQHGITKTRSFETEDWAKTYACGQALRLGMALEP